MFDHVILENLIRKYYPEGTDEQIGIVMDQLLWEAEIDMHRRIRKLINENRRSLQNSQKKTLHI